MSVMKINIINAVLIFLLLVLSTPVFAEELEEKCNRNDFSACAELGKNYYNGWNGYYKDNHKAYKFYKKGCEGNNAWSCENLGVIYEAGRGVRKNPKKADETYKKTCFELKRSRGCQLLAYSYAIGHNSVPKNHEKALMLYEKACKLYNGVAPDCFSLGALYQEGENKFLIPGDIKVKPNLRKALEIYGIGCDHGEDFSCQYYSKLYDILKKNDF